MSKQAKEIIPANYPSTLKSLNLNMGVPVNIKHYGAKGDDSTDDTVAIQAAIDAASHGTVIVPRGIYRFTHLIIDKGITLIGDGWDSAQNVATAYGIASWNTSPEGSVLRCTATSGTAITVGSSSFVAQVNIRHISIIGPGSGTSVGIGVGATGTTGILSSSWDNTLIGNFSTALQLGWIQQSIFSGLRLRGNDNGLDVTAAEVNANTFIGMEAQSNNNYAVRFSATGGSNIFVGGVFQANSIDSFIFKGNGNGVIGAWFENTAATGDDVRFASGASLCYVKNCVNFKRPIRFVNGADKCFADGNIANVSAPNMIFEASAAENYFNDNVNFVIVDTSELSAKNLKAQGSYAPKTIMIGGVGGMVSHQLQNNAGVSIFGQLGSDTSALISGAGGLAYSLALASAASQAIQLVPGGVNVAMTLLSNGKIGVNINSPSAYFHLPASTAAANTASLKIDAGVLATTPVSGNIESDGTHLYWTNSAGTRIQLDN